MFEEERGKQREGKREGLTPPKQVPRVEETLEHRLTGKK